MKEISKKILDKIKQDRIKPEPGWVTWLKTSVFWFLLAAIIILSAAFFSLVLLSVADFDLELMRQLKLRKFIGLLMISAPYVWLVMFVLLLILGFFVFRKTRRGYRYSVLFVAGAILLATSVLGVSAHIVKINNFIHRGILQGPPGLHKFASPAGEERFFIPGKGIIAGTITEKEDGFLKIKTFNDEEWEVFYDENTKYHEDDLIPNEKVVIVIGEKIEDRKFKAFGIKPMKGPKENFFQERMKERDENGPGDEAGSFHPAEKMPFPEEPPM